MHEIDTCVYSMGEYVTMAAIRLKLEEHLLFVQHVVSHLCSNLFGVTLCEVSFGDVDSR